MIRLRVGVHKIVTYPLFDTVIMVIIALRCDQNILSEKVLCSVCLWSNNKIIHIQSEGETNRECK